MTRIGILVLSSLLAVSAVEAGQMYRWVDENGVTHFSQSRPPQQNADELPLRGGKPRQPAAAETSTQPAIEGRQLYNTGWQACNSELCRIVRELDPDCTTPYCSQAKRFSKSCTSVTCRAKKIGFQREMEEQLALERSRRQQKRVAGTSEKSPAIPGAETDEERLQRLVAECEKNRGADCDTEEGKRWLMWKEMPLTHEERRQLRDVPPARQRAILTPES